MKNEIEIVRNLLEPLLGEEINNLINNNWKAITSGFVLFENDSKPLYTEIYKLETSNPENIISKLPELHQSFVYEMAEVYVLGKENTTTTTLIEQDSSLFSERVAFLKTLKNVISKLERHRISKELPNLSDNIDFSFSEANIKAAVKKKARGDLKNKLSNWDQELAEEPKKKGKIISLLMIKYAVAASIIITVGLFYFKSFNNSDNMVTILANVEASKQTVNIITDSGLGFVSDDKNKKIEVVLIDHNKRITSINKVIKENSIDGISSYKIELDSLIALKNTYVFNKKQLTLNSKKENQKINIIRLKDASFYLKTKEVFYRIYESTSPMKLVVEKDENKIKELEKAIFINE